MVSRTSGRMAVEKAAHNSWYQREEQDATVARLGGNNMCLGTRLDCATTRGVESLNTEV